MVVTAEQKVLQSVALQLMNGEEVALEEQKLRVKRVGRPPAYGAVQIERPDVGSYRAESYEAKPMGTTGTRKAPGGAVPGRGDT